MESNRHILHMPMEQMKEQGLQARC